MTIKNESIVDRVVQRLQTQPIGDLITEEDLHDIVKQAIPKAFFEERTVTTNKGSYSQTSTVEEPLIATIMRELLRDVAKQIVKDWVAENADLMIDYWRGVTDKNVVKYVQQIQNAESNTQVIAMVRPLLDGLNQERNRLGLPMIFLG